MIQTSLARQLPLPGIPHLQKLQQRREGADMGASAEGAEMMTCANAELRHCLTRLQKQAIVIA